MIYSWMKLWSTRNHPITKVMTIMKLTCGSARRNPNIEYLWSIKKSISEMIIYIKHGNKSWCHIYENQIWIMSYMSNRNIIKASNNTIPKHNWLWYYILILLLIFEIQWNNEIISRNEWLKEMSASRACILKRNEKSSLTAHRNEKL